MEVITICSARPLAPCPCPWEIRPREPPTHLKTLKRKKIVIQHNSQDLTRMIIQGSIKHTGNAASLLRERERASPARPLRSRSRNPGLRLLAIPFEVRASPSRRIAIQFGVTGGCCIVLLRSRWGYWIQLGVVCVKSWMNFSSEMPSSLRDSASLSLSLS